MSGLLAEDATARGLDEDEPAAPADESERRRVSQSEPAAAADLSELARPRLGAADRLIQLAYRCGVPAALLAAPFGRKPRPKLLATVANPLPGDRVAGTALRAGHFLVLGARLPVAKADLAAAAPLAPPFARAIHGFHWLADLDASTGREQAAPLAGALLGRWLDANPEAPARPADTGGWSVAVAGWRLLNWLVHAPLIASADKAPRSRALAAIAAHARWLDRHARRADDRLGALAGWSALAAAGLLLPAGRPRRLVAEAALVRGFGELVGEDGGMLSRSPLAQIEALALLVKLRACYRATRREPPPALETMLALLAPPLGAVLHADGSLGSWQGAWAIAAPRLSALLDASGTPRRAPRDTRQWGYQRIAARASVLQFDAAPPPLPRHAASACASTLAFELSHGGQRLVVNCGGAAAVGALVPRDLAKGLRATAAHSTLTLDDSNSTAIFEHGRVGRGVGAVDFDRRALDGEALRPLGRGATRLEASHDGYAGRFGLVHRRALTLSDDGAQLTGEDALTPLGRAAKRRKAAVAIRFHLGPGIACRTLAEGHGAQLTLPDGTGWRFVAEGGEVAIEDSVWIDGEGRPVPVRQLVIRAEIARGGGSYTWSLRKLG